MVQEELMILGKYQFWREVLAGSEGKTENNAVGCTGCGNCGIGGCLGGEKGFVELS